MRGLCRVCAHLLCLNVVAMLHLIQKLKELKVFCFKFKYTLYDEIIMGFVIIASWRFL